MDLIVGGLLGPTLLTGGLVGVEAMTFRRALRIKLTSIVPVAGIVGHAIYPGGLPNGHDLINQGPALVYAVYRFPGLHSRPGHNLAGSDGTVLVRVRLSAWSFQYSDADAITAALYDALEGVRLETWGSVEIIACIHALETDHAHKDKDLRTPYYQIDSEYDVRYRVAVPVRT